MSSPPTKNDECESAEPQVTAEASAEDTLSTEALAFLHGALCPPPEENNKVGRPLGYDEEVADKFLAEVQAGRSINEICEDNDQPARSTINRWRRRFPAFDEKVIRAARTGIHNLEDHAIAASRGFGDGEARKDIAWARLQIETDLEMANRRNGEVGKMEAAQISDPKMIEGTFEVVETDTTSYDDLIREWEKKTGVKSQALVEIAPSEPKQ